MQDKHSEAATQWCFIQKKFFNFIEKESPVNVFFCKFCKIFKITFFIEHLRRLLLFTCPYYEAQTKLTVLPFRKQNK